MTVKRGSEVLLGREDSTYAGSFNLFGGQQSNEFQYSDSESVFTHKGSPGLWQEREDGGTVRDLRVTLSGVVIPNTDDQALLAAVMGSSTRHQSMMFVAPGAGAIIGDWQITEKTISGELDGPAQWSFTAQLASFTSFVAAVRDRYDMQATLAIDYTQASFYALGVHQATFEALADSTYTRSGAATYPGSWDFSNGGTLPDALVEFAANAQPFGALGAMCANASTNQVTNPRLEGATIGTITGGGGGAHPSPVTAAEGGMTWAVSATGYEDGHPFTEYTLSGTASGDAAIYFEAFTQIVASNGQTWTASLGLRLVSGVLPGTLSLRIFEATAAGAFVTSGAGANLSSLAAPDSNRRRYYFTGTLDGGSTVARAYPALYFSGPSGAVACVFRVYAPQMELQGKPTPPIFPPVSTPGASTRGAETATVALSSSYYDDESCTLVTEVQPCMVNTTGFASAAIYMVGLYNAGSGTGYVYHYQVSTHISVLGATSSSVVLGTGTYGRTLAFGQVERQAIVVNSPAAAWRHKGGNGVNNDASAAISEAMDRLQFNSILGSSDGVFYLRRCHIIPAVLTEDELTDKVESA